MPTLEKPPAARPSKPERDALKASLRRHGYKAAEVDAFVAAGRSRSEIVTAVIEAQRQARPA